MSTPCKKRWVIKDSAFLIRTVCISLLLMVLNVARLPREEKTGISRMKSVLRSAETKQSVKLGCFFPCLCVSTPAAAIHLYKSSPGFFSSFWGVIVVYLNVKKMGSLNQFECLIQTPFSALIQADRCYASSLVCKLLSNKTFCYCDDGQILVMLLGFYKVLKS